MALERLLLFRLFSGTRTGYSNGRISASDSVVTLTLDRTLDGHGTGEIASL